MEISHFFNQYFLRASAETAALDTFFSRVLSFVA